MADSGELPMSQDLVSVVIPTRNRAPRVIRAVLSALDQTHREIEVIVVDDGSSDGTAEFLAEYRPPHGFQAVRVVENRGRAAARNRGVERAEGDLVVFLDDDMELDRGFLHAHRHLHEMRKGVVGVGNVVNHPEISVAPIDRYMSTRGAQKIRERLPLPWKYFSTNNSSVQREDLEAVGGFDENFVHYGFEDLELAWRLVRERGITLRFVAGASSFHIHPHSLEEVLAKKTLCGRSSLRYLFEKHPETRRELGYHRFAPPRAGDPFFLNLSRLFHRAVLSRPVYSLVKPMARLPLGRVTNKALDYLILYHYLEGLRNPL
jgi:glycosyltransferase involved in cell wall biosynthesis